MTKSGKFNTQLQQQVQLCRSNNQEGISRWPNGNGTACIYVIRKDGNNGPICKSKRDTDVKNRLLHYAGEGEGGMI